MKRLSEWQLTAAGFYRLLFAIVLVLITALSGRAQPPIPTTEGESTEDVFAAEALSPTVEAMLRSINERDPKTPAELMLAVVRLQQLRAYPESMKFLDRITSQNLDNEALAKLNNEIGTGVLFRLANEKMMPDAREFVHQIFAATRTVKTDGKRLQTLIGRLNNKDDEQRRLAMRGLAEAGPDAVAPLLQAARTSKGVSRKRIEAAMAQLGSQAEDALIAALGSPDPVVQATAARALGKAGTRKSLLPLIRPFCVGQDFVSQAASYAFNQLHAKRPASIGGSASLLKRVAKQHLAGRTSLKADFDGGLDVWSWSAEANNVVRNRMGLREATALTASRLAKDVYELSPTAEHAQLLMTCHLESDQLLHGVDELLPKGIGTAYEFSKSQGPSAVASVLADSLRGRHDAAAIGAIEVLSDTSQGVGGSVTGSTAHWAPMVQALQSPSRRVRHAAARGVMKIDPRGQYPGASFLLEALVDLSDVTGAAGALVGTPRKDVRAAMAGYLGGLGFSVQRANEGNPFLREAMRSSDYDVLLISDSLSHPTSFETIQQLRKDPQSHDLPVIILARQGRERHAEDLANLDEMAIAIPEFADEATLIAALEKVEKMAAKTTVSPARRVKQAKDALDWLGHLAEFSQTYPWYDVMRAESVAVNASTLPELAPSAVKLMGFLGGESAQETLINIASLGGPAEGRQRAANAFGEAVLRRGLMLPHASVRQQYARYNGSETADDETQEILGQVLDVIETQTRPTAIKTSSSLEYE